MSKEKAIDKVKQTSVVLLTLVLMFTFGLGTETIIMSIMGL
jgi:hypothetical protein